MLGRQCQIMELEVEQRGWFLVDVDDDSFGPHRIALSTILSVIGDDNLIIETENTIYIRKRLTPFFQTRNYCVKLFSKIRNYCVLWLHVSSCML